MTTFFRHPFERLVSCYKDKFETGSKNDYIFQKFNPSIIESKTERPTFVEFVEYLIRTPIEKYNDHWLPNWIHCQVCTQNYDIIGKNMLCSNIHFNYPGTLVLGQQDISFTIHISFEALTKGILVVGYLF